MNIIIIPVDKVAVLDGVYRKFDTVINTKVHALRWDGAKGDVEYSDKKGETIEDFTPFQPLLDIVLSDYAAQDIVVAAEKVITDGEEAVEQELRDDLTSKLSEPAMLRERAYPSASDQLMALHKARQGDSADLIQIDSDIMAINLANPL